MDDWSKLITDCLTELQKAKIGFSDFMALYYKAKEDPEELKLFA